MECSCSNNMIESMSGTVQPHPISLVTLPLNASFRFQGCAETARWNLQLQQHRPLALADSSHPIKHLAICSYLCVFANLLCNSHDKIPVVSQHKRHYERRDVIKECVHRMMFIVLLILLLLVVCWQLSAVYCTSSPDGWSWTEMPAWAALHRTHRRIPLQADPSLRRCSWWTQRSRQSKSVG